MCIAQSPNRPSFPQFPRLPADLAGMADAAEMLSGINSHLLVVLFAHQYQFWDGHYTVAHFAGDSVFLPDAVDATAQYVRDLLNGQVQDASAYLYFPSCI